MFFLNAIRRLALAAVDAAKCVPYVHQSFKDDLHSIYKFFDNSATRSSHLKEIQALLEDDELKMAAVGDTRWLS